MSGPKRMAAAVSVATVWTKPESPRPVDEPALKNPVRLQEWLDGMTLDERLDLCGSNRAQTQILYGTCVLVEEEQGDWVKALIPQQGTRKNDRGYPGWIPRCQLVDVPEASADEEDLNRLRAEVVSNQARLYRSPSESDSDSGTIMELSFLTSLPVLEVTEGWVKVQTPEGCAYLKAGEVTLSGTGVAPASTHAEGGIGAGIVETGKRFLGLPYLWGGLSSFGYDCSGFAYSMHRYFGISIPRDASDQGRQGTPVEREELLPGDLLFFAHEEGKGAIHHVGIYAGEDRMIHSPKTGETVEIVDLSGYRLIKEHCASRRYWGT